MYFSIRDAVEICSLGKNPELVCFASWLQLPLKGQCTGLRLLTALTPAFSTMGETIICKTHCSFNLLHHKRVFDVNVMWMLMCQKRLKGTKCNLNHLMDWGNYMTWNAVFHAKCSYTATQKKTKVISIN